MRPQEHENMSGADGSPRLVWAGFPGDPHSETDGIVRGICTAPTWGSEALPSRPYFFGIEGGEDASVCWPNAEPQCSSERFWLGDVPPMQPEDVLFRLEPTTVTVHGVSPEEVGNAILAVLSLDLEASITKVRRAKFAINATALNDHGTCNVKVRIRTDGVGRLTAEFQRRGGSSIAFREVFQRAVVCLKGRLVGSAVVTGKGEVLQFSCPTPPLMHQQDQDDRVDLHQGLIGDSLEPLFDMALASDNAELQAQAAAALLRAAKRDPAPLGELTSVRGLRALGTLLGAGFAVSSPAARLLEFLAGASRGAQLWTAEGLLPEAVKIVALPSRS